jgi:hypothetical protein
VALPNKKPSRRKPVPRILRTPIEVSKFGDRGSIERQVDERIPAVYDLYGVDREAPQSTNQLVEAMARKRFPGAFKLCLKGYPKTKKPKWTSAAREHLLEHQPHGLSTDHDSR